MALTPILQTTAEYQARDIVRSGNIMLELNEASMCGPWRYSPEEVSEMWSELCDLNETIRERKIAISAIHDPWIVWSFNTEVHDLVCGLS